MSKRDFFRIVIRLIGTLSLISALFQTLPNLVAQEINYQNIGSELGFAVIAIMVLLLLLTIMFYRLLFLYTDKIIDWLRLDKGYDSDHIVLGENGGITTLLRIALVVFGLYVLVNNIFPLLYNIYYSFRSRIDLGIDSQFESSVAGYDWFYYIGNFMIAIILINYNEVIANWILGAKRKAEDEN